jgi:hypothetical protein
MCSGGQNALLRGRNDFSRGSVQSRCADNPPASEANCRVEVVVMQEAPVMRLKLVGQLTQPASDAPSVQVHRRGFRKDLSVHRLPEQKFAMVLRQVETIVTLEGRERFCRGHHLEVVNEEPNS